MGLILLWLLGIPIPLLILIIIGVSAYLYYGKSSQNYIGVVEATILSHTSEVSESSEVWDIGVRL